MSSFIKETIPSTWSIKKLKDVTFINTENFDPKTADFINYIDIASINTETYQIQDTRKIPISEIPSRARRIVRENDVIISTVRPYLKAFTKINAKFDGYICSTGFAVLRAKKGLNPDFLFNWIFSQNFMNFMISNMVGSNYPAVKKTDVEVAPIIIPPLTEQNAISSILCNVDKLFEETNRIINLLHILKKGLLQRLFTKGIRHTDFKETNWGKIPNYWEILDLGKICDLRKDFIQISKEIIHKYIGLEHLESFSPFIRQWNTSENILSPKSPSFLINDVLYGKLRPYLAKSAIATFQGICSSDILVLKSNENYILPSYLVNLLHTPRFIKFSTARMSGTSLPRTSWKDLKLFKVFLPDLKEQHQIIQILDNLGEKIRLEEQYRISLINVKKGLMHLLLTGKKRIPLNEGE